MYRHYVVVPGVIDRRCRQVASGRFLDVLTPPSHHRTPAFDVVSLVVGASDFVLVDMRRGNLNQKAILLIFVLNFCFYFYMEYQLEYLANLHPNLTSARHSSLDHSGPY